MQFLDSVVGFRGTVSWAVRVGGDRVVGEVNVFGDVDSTIVKDVCVMMVDSFIEFLCGVWVRQKKEKKGKVTHPTIAQTNKHNS